MQDELFSPTIGSAPPPGRRPWRPESIAYPAFFGGPLAAATLGVLNGRRLALPTGRLLAIGAAGLAAFGGRIAATAATDSNAGARLIGAAAGLLVWLLVLLWQRQPFRVTTLRGVEPANLIGPGLAAAVVGGIFEAAVILGVTR